MVSSVYAVLALCRNTQSPHSAAVPWHVRRHKSTIVLCWRSSLQL